MIAGLFTCEHATSFHKHCIRTWIASNLNSRLNGVSDFGGCPICRAALVVKTKKAQSAAQQRETSHPPAAQQRAPARTAATRQRAPARAAATRQRAAARAAATQQRVTAQQRAMAQLWIAITLIAYIASFYYFCLGKNKKKKKHSFRVLLQ